jgi:hypothetical protein
MDTTLVLEPGFASRLQRGEAMAFDAEVDDWRLRVTMRLATGGSPAADGTNRLRLVAAQVWQPPLAGLTGAPDTVELWRDVYSGELWPFVRTQLVTIAAALGADLEATPLVFSFPPGPGAGVPALWP